MIKSFSDGQAQAIFAGKNPGKGFPANMIRAARRKLIMLNNAYSVEDLRSPPGNRLEVLKGDREGQHSIRLNDQWRICFVWNDGAKNVEIVDYH
jgi:proteic killer suppression protein